MSELKTNKISTNDTNNVAIDNALGLKSYDTTARDALTSVAGDMIYNTTDSKVQFHNGTAWADFSTPQLEVSYLVIAGGGAGGGGSIGNRSGGGGAGGYRNSYASETSGGGGSTETPLTLFTGQDYMVQVGAGGAIYSGSTIGRSGSNSSFNTVLSLGGGVGTTFGLSGEIGGSGGGGAYNGAASIGTTNQGFAGGAANTASLNNFIGGGGGGAGAAGSTRTGDGAGGAGLSSSITGSAVSRGGGGGGGVGSSRTPATAQDGGGKGAEENTSASTAGTANTGGGGGGNESGQAASNGGSGVVILRYSSDYSITVGSGLTTGTETTDGSDKYIEITAGYGAVSWA